MSSLTRQSAPPSTQTPTVEPSTQQSVGPAPVGSAHGNAATAQGAGLTGDQATCTPDAQSEAEKQAFLAPPIYGPQDMAHAISQGSGVGIGGFEASYVPAASLLIVRVTGKVQFKDAIQGSHPSFTTEHSDLDNLVTFMNALPAATAAQILPAFQWTPESKAEHLTQFNARLAEAQGIWQNTGMGFQVNDPCWNVQASPVFSLQVGEEGTATAGQHLQVSVYKEPTRVERGQIQAALAAAGQAAMQQSIMGIRANAGTNLGSNAPGAPANSTDENPLQNEMSLSSSDLYAVPDPRQRGGNTMLRLSVTFPNDSARLTGDQITEIRDFVGGFAEGDTIAENSRITLRGFASASGAADYNRGLVDRRIAAVQGVITGSGVAAGRIATDNRGNAEASGPDVGRDAGSQANERRVEIRIGSGERQHTIAHEFGHVFGLSDEYVEDTRTPGQNSWQDPTVRAAGVSAGSQIEQNDNMMSLGNTVRPQHYATFAWALNQLTAANLRSRQWHVRS